MRRADSLWRQQRQFRALVMWHKQAWVARALRMQSMPKELGIKPIGFIQTGDPSGSTHQDPGRHAERG